MEFRIPLPNPNPDSVLGMWSIVATTEVSSVVITDIVNFTVVNKPSPSSVVTISGITLPTSVARSGTLNVNVTVEGLNSTALLSITVGDAQEVPIDCYTANINPATGGGSIIVPVSVTIPSWAYVGTATVYVDLMSSLPTTGGVPLCPQVTGTFQITS